MSLARRMRFGEVDEIWFGGSSSLGSSQEKFSVREMRSETSMVPVEMKDEKSMKKKVEIQQLRWRWLTGKGDGGRGEGGGSWRRYRVSYGS